MCLPVVGRNEKKNLVLQCVKLEKKRKENEENKVHKLFGLLGGKKKFSKVLYGVKLKKNEENNFLLTYLSVKEKKNCF